MKDGKSEEDLARKDSMEIVNELKQVFVFLLKTTILRICTLGFNHCHGHYSYHKSVFFVYSMLQNKPKEPEGAAGDTEDETGQYFSNVKRIMFPFKIGIITVNDFHAATYAHLNGCLLQSNLL